MKFFKAMSLIEEDETKVISSSSLTSDYTYTEFMRVNSLDKLKLWAGDDYTVTTRQSDLDKAGEICWQKSVSGRNISKDSFIDLLKPFFDKLKEV